MGVGPGGGGGGKNLLNEAMLVSIPKQAQDLYIPV